ncbi:MAG: TFIIB-type zinc finger domain-containing protein [Butyrivibrio sp.]|jgi:tetratricopeptide (TPR) repeat protein|nr:TFIIB-type zinc finger domain-containing protein [Butyrivibrio sp.]
MKAIVCEMCGSNDVVKVDGVYVCQACGTKYSVEEAKKLMVEVSGTVSLDNSDKLENLYQLARRARDSNDISGAANYYEQIAMEDANSWEAAFYSTFFKCKNCKVGEIGTSANLMKNTLPIVFNMVRDSDFSDSEKIGKYDEMYQRVMELALMLSNAGVSHCSSNMSADGVVDTFKAWENEVFALLMLLGDIMKEYANDKQKAKIAYSKVLEYSSNAGAASWFTYARGQAESKIKDIDPEYVAPPSTGGCYVATAVYGSYDCPEVWTLRRYRDYNLAMTWYGRTFIQLYYAISPYVVRVFGDTKWFKALWRGHLDKLVRRLQEKGFESTPYEDQKWN